MASTTSPLPGEKGRADVAAAAVKAAALGKLHGYDFYRSIGSPKRIVAPMVDQSELSFRMLCRLYGADLCYTPMLHSRIALEQGMGYLEKAFTTCPADKPVIVQFCGNDPDTVLGAARLVQDYATAIDLNLGCPQGIAKRGNYGSWLLPDTARVASIVKALHDNLRVPVTVKIRKLPTWEHTLATVLALQEAGASIITVHGRLREHIKERINECDWDTIKRIRAHPDVQIPIFANGGIGDYSDVQACLEYTGVEGVMSSEALLENPGLFSDRYLSAPSLPPFPAIAPAASSASEAAGSGPFPSKRVTGYQSDSLDLAWHYLQIAEHFGEDTGCVRGHLMKMLFSVLKINVLMRNKILSAHSIAAWKVLLREICLQYKHPRAFADNNELIPFLKQWTRLSSCGGNASSDGDAPLMSQAALFKLSEERLAEADAAYAAARERLPELLAAASSAASSSSSSASAAPDIGELAAAGDDDSGAPAGAADEGLWHTMPDEAEIASYKPPEGRLWQHSKCPLLRPRAPAVMKALVLAEQKRMERVHAARGKALEKKAALKEAGRAQRAAAAAAAAASSSSTCATCDDAIASYKSMAAGDDATAAASGPPAEKRRRLGTAGDDAGEAEGEASTINAGAAAMPNPTTGNTTDATAAGVQDVKSLRQALQLAHVHRAQRVIREVDWSLFNVDRGAVAKGTTDVTELLPSPPSSSSSSSGEAVEAARAQYSSWVQEYSDRRRLRPSCGYCPPHWILSPLQPGAWYMRHQSYKDPPMETAPAASSASGEEGSAPVSAPAVLLRYGGRCERKDGPEAFLDALPEHLQLLCGWKGWRERNPDTDIKRLEALLEEAQKHQQQQQSQATGSAAAMKVTGSVSAAAAVAAYEASVAAGAGKEAARGGWEAVTVNTKK